MNITDIKSFIDIIYSHFFQPFIAEPTRIIGRNKSSLIDNIFINACTKSLNAGNITKFLTIYLT